MTIAILAFIVGLIVVFLVTRSAKGNDVPDNVRLALHHRLLSLVQPYVRRRRMQLMRSLLPLKPGLRVIDLGGTSAIWTNIDIPLDITIVNLPGEVTNKIDVPWHKVRYVEGDATSMDYPDNSFDLVFSNSVIEHVGDIEKRRSFAREARRLAPLYCIQTPSVYFPLEAHTGLPLWWMYPHWLKERLHKQWARTLPAWNDMILGTTFVRKSELRVLFPDALVRTERVIGIPKSYTVYRLG